jgi:hypothetical protein
MIKILLLSLMLSITCVEAQTSEKKHFIIHRVDNSIDVAKYQAAIDNWGQLDRYRLLDKRRIIYFTDSKLSIELLSAQELLVTYGKQISPNTIKSSNYTEIAFELTQDGKSIKPQLIK